MLTSYFLHVNRTSILQPPRLARLSMWCSLVNSWIALSSRCYQRLLLTLKHMDVENSDSNNISDNSVV